MSPAKRARLEAEYGNMVQSAHQSDRDRVEVIKLPSTINSNGAYNLSKSNAQAKDTSFDSSNEWATGLNLSGKASTTSSTDDGDAPLNLCMKADGKTGDSSSSATTGTNSLQSLSHITAALGSGSGNDRMCKLFATSKENSVDSDVKLVYF